MTDGESGELMDGMSAHARAMVKIWPFRLLGFHIDFTSGKAVMSADVVIQQGRITRCTMCPSVRFTCPSSVLFRSQFGKTKLIYDASSGENRFTPNRRGLVKAKFHYAIQLANQLASCFASWSATC